MGIDLSPNLLVMEKLSGVAAELDRLLAEHSPGPAVAGKDEVARAEQPTPRERNGMLARVWARLRQGAGG